MERRNALVLAFFIAAAGIPTWGEPPPVDFCRQDALGGTQKEAYARRSGGYCDGAVFQPNAGDGELPVIGVRAAAIAGALRDAPVSLTVIPVPGAASGIV